MIPAPQPGEPLSVAQAVTLFNTVLGDLSLTVEGEIANYKVNQGKFVFFDLKDEEQDCRLACFMMLFKQNVPLEDGMRVRMVCHPSIHSKTGKFSLIVDHIEPKGEGSLKRAFELLKKKLQDEGLFAIERKRALPAYPGRVGIISSEDAAGYGDFMRIASQRQPGVSFTLAHCAVQGREAEEDICFAFDYLNSHYELDVIVLVRGGGSMEDLHAFNSESVARAIARSKAPVLVGVGHEQDTTIADFCADVRAATPSNAAQILLKTADEIYTVVERLASGGIRRVEQQVQRLWENTSRSIERMHTTLMFKVETTRQRVEQIMRTVTAVSPEMTLARGYSITWDAKGRVVRSTASIAINDTIRTQLADGYLTSTIL